MGSDSAGATFGAAPPDRPRRLSADFLRTGGLLLIFAMVGAGLAIGQLVERSTINSKAAATAVFMQSITAPLSEELASTGRLTVESVQRLNGLMSSSSLGERFPYLEIWLPDGSIVYSNSPMLIGRRFPLPPALKLALAGEVVADYADLRAGEHTSRNLGVAYLEVYSPLRSQADGTVVAVAEIHERTQPLEADLLWLRIATWIVVAVMTMLIMLGLYGIVRRGTRTIDVQYEAIMARIAEAERLAMLNKRLSDRLQRASMRSVEIHERTLRAVGADLHDGPAQLISFANLNLDAFRSGPPEQRDRLGHVIGAALKEAIVEIRAIASGLVLPELRGLPVHEVVRRAVAQHGQRSSTEVALDAEPIDLPVSEAVRICAFRFVQEGLNNATRHGGSRDQRVSVALHGTQLTIKVSNGNPAKAADTQIGDDGSPQLGLLGLRERVESLGGRFEAELNADPAILTMTLALQGGLIEPA